MKFLLKDKWSFNSYFNLLSVQGRPTRNADVKTPAKAGTATMRDQPLASSAGAAIRQHQKGGGAEDTQTSAHALDTPHRVLKAHLLHSVTHTAHRNNVYF